MSYSLSLKRFEGKLAVVTGAAFGIGKAITEALVKEGVIVATLDIRVQQLKNNAKELSGKKGKIYPFECDLTKEEDILSTFKKVTEIGPIHVLINNAGVVYGGNIIDGNIEKWKLTLNTNVLAVAITIREAIANMKTHNTKGQIININSATGHRVIDFPGLNLYAASKYAITALTETVRLEINREKLPIKITSLSPGGVETEMHARAFGDEMARQIRENPILFPEDMAAGALYILSTPEHVNVKELTILAQGGIA